MMRTGRVTAFTTRYRMLCLQLCLLLLRPNTLGQARVSTVQISTHDVGKLH